MFTRIIGTSPDRTSLLLRLVLGIVMFPHGAQKLLGWFGGYGFQGTMGYFTGTLGIPWIFGFLAILAEFFGALGLIAGALTRVAALGVAGVMVVAGLTVFGDTGQFFMNWTGQQQGEGIEFHLIALALAVALIIRGGGALSVDRALTRAMIDPHGGR